MTHSNPHRILRTFALGAAVTALAAPGLQAAVRPDDRADARGPGATLVEQSVRPDDRADARGPGATVVVAATAVRPDDRPEARGPGAIVVVAPTALRPDDRPEARGPGATVVVTATPVRPDDRPAARGPGVVASPAPIVIAPTGFDWTDAGIGFAAAFGIALLAGGFLLVARRHRRSSLAAV